MPDSGYPWPIETTRLDNGLRVVVSEDRTAPAVAVNLWYDVGSRHEPQGQTGFAHLFEHLMFEGSVNVAKTEHMKLVQGAGGSLNATTNPDRTNYFETMPAEHLELALWLEADRMGGLVPALTQETLDNQRDVVKNERRQRYENVPYGDAWLRLLPLLYPPGHPYHHATIGSMEDLNAADLATFQAFHATYYAPNNAVLTVVGDASATEVFALADKYFGAIPARPEIPPAPDGSVVPGGRPAVETVTADVPAPRVFVAHRTHPFGSAGYHVVTVLATVLGSGRGSRLYQRLADGERLAQPDLVGAYGVDLAHAPAPLIVTATARPGVSAERLSAGLSDVVDELATVPVTAAELDRAKALLSTAWWRQLSTVDGRADLLGRYATQFGDPARLADQLPALLAVTSEQIAEVAAEVLTAADRVTLTYLPEETS
ncbi:M16 family metallopeptidase [Micromonospora endolithica]|uniref:Insulinase family protein n=1 Tax=Micromonospora endolithica TaxID=230091 RepID=A0A3A9Z3U7_9ACTN|nr:pitrilysin family protein [Micromonospora endolithica]RKN42066.1 insulinase family protein [Micromonospora endolithica]TWJ26304.1 putative Zn-dependent peptidase [Micromonospora endolithica]